MTGVSLGVLLLHFCLSKNTCLFFYLCGDPIVMANLGTVAENREETVFVSKLSFVVGIKKNVMS